MQFKKKLWKYPSEKAAWYFVTLLKKEVIKVCGGKIPPHVGWGSIPVSVTVGNSTWQTSLFRDTKRKGYVLPMKAAIRKKEHITEGTTITFDIQRI